MFYDPLSYTLKPAAYSLKTVLKALTVVYVFSAVSSTTEYFKLTLNVKLF